MHFENKSPITISLENANEINKWIIYPLMISFNNYYCETIPFRFKASMDTWAEDWNHVVRVTNSRCAWDFQSERKIFKTLFYFIFNSFVKKINFLTRRDDINLIINLILFSITHSIISNITSSMSMTTYINWYRWWWKPIY